jgi:hypothetical protein
MSMNLILENSLEVSCLVWNPRYNKRSRISLWNFEFYFFSVSKFTSGGLLPDPGPNGGVRSHLAPYEWNFVSGELAENSEKPVSWPSVAFKTFLQTFLFQTKLHFTLILYLIWYLTWTNVMPPAGGLCKRRRSVLHVTLHCGSVHLK